MCENWFQKRVKAIQSGAACPNSSKGWSGSLKYAKETKRFVMNFKNIGRDFLINKYGIQRV
jgi:hypothetical protein